MTELFDQEAFKLNVEVESLVPVMQDGRGQSYDSMLGTFVSEREENVTSLTGVIKWLR